MVLNNKQLSERSDSLLVSTGLNSFQPNDGLWYRPKYRIIGVENKSSRISLNLELVHRYNTKLMNSAINKKCFLLLNVLANRITYIKVDSNERETERGRDESREEMIAEQMCEQRQRRGSSRSRGRTRSKSGGRGRSRSGAETKFGRVPCDERKMRQPELDGEERSYIGSSLSARGYDCHEHA